jgi:hypothetical protein
MKTTLPPRDWQALSDYLDGQLSPKNRLRLEARLKTDASLRLALEELRRTRVILSNAPRLRAPRNFTLTQAMVTARPPRRSHWTPFTLLRLSSATAALLFILVFLGDFLWGGLSAVQIARAPTTGAERQVLEAAPATEPPSDQANQFTAPTEAPAPAELPAAKAIQGQATSETPAALPTLAASAPYPEPPALSAKMAPSPTITQSLGIAALPTPAPEETTPDETTLEAYPSTEATPATLGAGAPAEATEPTPGGEALAEHPSRLPSWTLFRMVEIGLAALAVITGLAAFFVRRAGNA